MKRLSILLLLGLVCAAPAGAVEYTPVLGEFVLSEHQLDCGSGAPYCYTCINDANTTADHRLIFAFGAAYPNLQTTGLAIGVLHPFIEIDGVRLDPPLWPCASVLRSGIRWFDRPFAQNCPDTTKGLIYEIGDMPQVEVTGDGDAFFDIDAADADGIPFRFSICSEFVHWGAGCEISGSSQYGFRLITPGVPRAFEAAAGDAVPVAFASHEVAFDPASGPGGKVSVARVNADPPGTPAVEHLNGYWDVHTDMPAGSFSIDIEFAINPASLPEGVDVAGIVVAGYAPSTGMWEPLMTTVDEPSLTATITADRMTKFVLLESAPVPVDQHTWGGVKARYR